MGDSCLPDEPAFVIFDLLTALVHASQLERPKVYVPESIADFFETDVFAGQRVRDADPSLLPADAAVATDEPDFKVSGVFEGRELRGAARAPTADSATPASPGRALRAGGRRCTPDETD